mgnify:FL=1
MNFLFLESFKFFTNLFIDCDKACPFSFLLLITDIYGHSKKPNSKLSVEIFFRGNQMSKINAVVFDWAGTLIDQGSIAPVVVFKHVFSSENIEVTLDECRAPMGIAKKQHIAEMLFSQRIKAKFSEVVSREPDSGDVERMYETFLRINEDVVLEYVVPIPGAVECFSYLRQQNIKIGGTTGYGMKLMSQVLPKAAKLGLEPDTIVCGDELSEARPSPLMMYQNFINLNVYPPETVIKVDDTVPGIQEGVAAGTLTVGLTLSGNAAGLTKDEFDNLSEASLADIHKQLSKPFFDAGADYVLRSISELPSLIDNLQSK